MARVLLVEDDESFGELLGIVCTEWGHEWVLVRDGAEAFRELAGHGVEYDLILCDLQMPRMPGRLFLQRVAGLIQHEIPVIVLSAERSLIEALGDVRPWLFDVVEKGCSMPVLRSVMERALEKRSAYLAERADENRIRRLERRNEFLLRQAESMYEKSRLDPMTGLAIRLRLEEEFAGLLAAGGSFGGNFVLALCDIDDFRRMNKDYGYEGGDKAIIQCADLMRSALRAGDLLYRYGGDEFVLLVKADSVEQGGLAVERLRRTVALAPGAVVDAMRLPPITLSAGLAASRGTKRRTLSVLIHEATLALRHAKDRGGNRVWPPPQEYGPEEAMLAS